MESNKLARSPTDCFDSAPSQVQDADGALDLQLSAGRVEFDGVCFSYAPGCVARRSSHVHTILIVY